jgi:flagellar basal-body rod protein FlgB
MESGDSSVNVINGPEYRRLQGAIGAAELRQKVIADNVANVDTPYFKRSEVVFEDLLEQSMGGSETPQLPLRRTNARHLAGGGMIANDPRAQIVRDETSVMNNNVNNVDIDREMSLLAKNQLRYNALIQQTNHEIKMMRTVIEGR